MTYAPADISAVRTWLIAAFDLVKGTARGVDLEANEVGIVGDPAHAATGGYHEGNDDLSRVGRLTTDYSKRESGRDRPGTNAASALDIGDFDATVGGRRHTLRSLSAAIVAACRAGDERARDVREVIWSPDGSTVQRWDRLGLRTSGDGTHRWHTHISFFRDAEGRRHLDDNFLGLLKAVANPSEDDMLESSAAGRNTHNRVYAIMTLQPYGDDKTNPLAEKLREISADARASRLAVEALAKLVNAGGGDVDTAVVLARMDELAAADRARDEAQAARVTDLERELADRDARLAEALAPTD